MIEKAQGNILHANTEALVNTVNCVGVMGRGIALQFRKAFPDNYTEYKKACDAGQLHPGHMLIHERTDLHNPRYIINFPTKRHWKGKSRISDIEAGLKALIKDIRQREIHSIAIPPLGCGLGGLDWSQVRPLIVDAFRDLPNVRVLLFEPTDTLKTIIKQPTIPTMTAGRAALIGLINRYLAAVMDPTVTLLEVHKLMYFMQETGEPLQLKFKKAPYGPYAENLRHVLNYIEGHFISGFGDAEDRPDKALELLPHAAQQAEAFLSKNEPTKKRFERVTNLINGFETAFGMELLATVHWIATREGAKNPEEAVTLTHAWNKRKRAFTPQQINLVWQRLEFEDWIKIGKTNLTNSNWGKSF